MQEGLVKRKQEFKCYQTLFYYIYQPLILHSRIFKMKVATFLLAFKLRPMILIEYIMSRYHTRFGESLGSWLMVMQRTSRGELKHLRIYQVKTKLGFLWENRIDQNYSCNESEMSNRHSSSHPMQKHSFPTEDPNAILINSFRCLGEKKGHFEHSQSWKKESKWKIKIKVANEYFLYQLMRFLAFLCCFEYLGNVGHRQGNLWLSLTHGLLPTFTWG